MNTKGYEKHEEGQTAFVFFVALSRYRNIIF